MSRRVGLPRFLEQRVLSVAVVAWATPLRDQQGDFARKSVLAAVKAHLASELTSNDIFNDARTEAAMRGQRDGGTA